MASQYNDTYMFSFEAVREKVPNASGVFTLFTPQRWVYVGESDDIKRSLFQILNKDSASMNRFGPLSFSIELAPAAERKLLQLSLIDALKPACQAE